MGKRGLAISTAAFVASLSLTTGTLADSASVPLGLQVDLIAKITDYDRNLPGRSEGVVRVAVVTRREVVESASAAARAMNALSNVATISGLPHEDSLVEFTDGASLATLCKSRSISVLYVMPGLADVAASLSEALAGIPVLVVSATAEGVSKGMDLGFDLIGGKPKILVNPRALQRQGIRLSSDLLTIAKVTP